MRLTENTISARNSALLSEIKASGKRVRKPGENGFAMMVALIEQKIRVNGVAPDPIWTPLIPSTFTPEHVEKFGSDVPMKRTGQPEKIATCLVFLAFRDSSYMSGQIPHPNGGTVVNG